MAVLTNLAEVQAQLKEFGTQASNQISKSTGSRVGARIRTELRRMAPRGDSGELRRSIRTKTRRGRNGLYYTQVRLTSNQFYYTLIYGERGGYRKKNGTRVRAHKVKKYPNWFEELIRSRGQYFSDMAVDIAQREMLKQAAKTYSKTARSVRRRVR